MPKGGKIIHLLWTVYFWIVYPKQATECIVVGGLNGVVNPKTFYNYVWTFIYALADPELVVVSSFVFRSFLETFVQF